MTRNRALWLSMALLSGTTLGKAETQAENIAAARALGVQGVRLAEEGNCKQAIEKLERAESLYHAPTILGRLGECQVETGQIVRGTENLNRVVREQLPPNAPQAYIAAQARARKVMDKALPRIAYLVVRVQPATVAATVSVGGTPLPQALVGADRPTDPGTHEIVATAPGYLEVTTSVTLAEGGRQEVSLSLTVAPNAQTAITPAPTTHAEPAPTAPAPELRAAASPDHTFAYLLLGVGGAGLVTGSITGLLAINKKGGLECPSKQCLPDQHDTLNSAQTFATVSTISFGVGIAAAATGTVLLLTGTSRPEARVGSLSARPWASQRALGVEGSF